MERPVLRRTNPILFIAIGIFLLLAAACGIGWYNTDAQLQQVRQDRDFQLQETQKYLELSDRQGIEIQQYSLQLSDTQGKLKATESNLDSIRSLYDVTSSRLNLIDSQLQQTRDELAKVRAELQLYKDTWGSVVASGVRPPFVNVRLIEQPAAVNRTWSEVQSYILADRTDRKLYIPGVYVCGEFASDVHNNAEAAGIRCALVAIKFKTGWHACNAFMTTDRGLVFIDCTGIMDRSRSTNCDKIVNVRLGQDYLPVSMFPEPGWIITWENMGTILDVQVYW